MPQENPRGVLTLVLSGEAPPRGPTPCSSYANFKRKGTDPFRIPSRALFGPFTDPNAGQISLSFHILQLMTSLPPGPYPSVYIPET